MNRTRRQPSIQADGTPPKLEATPHVPWLPDAGTRETPDQTHGTLDLCAAACRALGPIIARGLGFDLPAAIRARRVRFLALHTVDGRPLPRDWAIPVLDGEVVVACARLETPLVGVAALVIDLSTLPAARLDDAGRRRLAEALVDALLAEVRAHPRDR